MIKFRRHIPMYAYDDKDPPQPTYEVTTTAELLALPAVAQFAKSKDFSHFALDKNMLMAIEDDGFWWWVVGYISGSTKVDLPKWRGWKFRARLPDGRITVLSTEVVSSCGGLLTLRDGTTAMELQKEPAK